jgi:hypothetical protein
MHCRCPSESRGRRECRCIDRTRSLACKRKNARKQVTTGTPKQSGIPCAMVYGLYRALLGVPGLIAPVASRNVSQSLTSASGGQDHTISPSASACSSRAPPASIASRTACRDDRDPPLCPVRDGWTIQLICISEKEKYFCGEGLTRFRKISPSGKSVGPEWRHRFGYQDRTSRLPASRSGHDQLA